MRAIIADPSAPEALRLADVPEPVAGPGQVLVEVHHASLNHGTSTTPAPAAWRRVGCWGRMPLARWYRPRPMAAGQRRAPVWSP